MEMKAFFSLYKPIYTCNVFVEMTGGVCIE